MEAWETFIGQAFTNAFGSSAAMYILGIFLVMAIVWYCVSFGLSSEVILLAGGITIVFFSIGTFSNPAFGLLPPALGVVVILLAGLYIYKAASQVPNG